jgi:hypothetical protein
MRDSHFEAGGLSPRLSPLMVYDRHTAPATSMIDAATAKTNPLPRYGSATPQLPSQ